MLTLWNLLCKYDFIHSSDRWSKLYNRSFFSKIPWFTKSKAFRKSKKVTPVILPWSISFSHVSVIFVSAVWQEWNCLKPDCSLCKRSCVERKSRSCDAMCFSNSFDIVGRIESTEVDRRTWLHVPSLGDSLVHQQWHSPSSWNSNRTFY